MLKRINNISYFNFKFPIILPFRYYFEKGKKFKSDCKTTAIQLIHILIKLIVIPANFVLCFQPKKERVKRVSKLKLY